MAPVSDLSVRPLALADITSYLQVLVAADADSGAAGVGHSNAYSAAEPFPMDGAAERETVRWTTEITVPGWRRAWGLFGDDTLVGHAHLVGGSISTELHRVSLGMGITAPFRRLGGGTALLEAALRWSQAEPTIDWVDLGVFSDNVAASVLYRRHGFSVVGRVTDRYRVDGAALDEILMTLAVSTSA